METTIIIDCEDKRELLVHLDVIKRQLEEVVDTDVEEGLELEDSNCYGTHILKIKNG